MDKLSETHAKALKIHGACHCKGTCTCLDMKARHVASPEGSRRYKLPIGSPIAKAPHLANIKKPNLNEPKHTADSIVADASASGYTHDGHGMFKKGNWSVSFSPDTEMFDGSNPNGKHFQGLKSWDEVNSTVAHFDSLSNPAHDKSISIIKPGETGNNEGFTWGGSKVGDVKTTAGDLDKLFGKSTVHEGDGGERKVTESWHPKIRDANGKVHAGAIYDWMRYDGMKNPDGTPMSEEDSNNLKPLERSEKFKFSIGASSPEFADLVHRALGITQDKPDSGVSIKNHSDLKKQLTVGRQVETLSGIGGEMNAPKMKAGKIRTIKKVQSNGVYLHDPEIHKADDNGSHLDFGVASEWKFDGDKFTHSDGRSYRLLPKTEGKGLEQEIDVEYKTAYSNDARMELAKKGEAMPDGSYPIAHPTDLRNAIDSFGRAKDPSAVKNHITKRAEDMKMSYICSLKHGLLMTPILEKR